MFRKSISQVGLGLVISLVVSGAAYWNLFLETIDIFGYAELKNPEARHGRIFYTSLAVTLITLVVAFICSRIKLHDFATGFVIPACIGIFPMLAVGPTYFDKSNYYETFDSTRWLNNSGDRIKMARYMVKTNMLNGLTRDEVIRKLGNDFFDNGEMNYQAVYDFCFLGIRFEDGKVVDYSLWVRD